MADLYLNGTPATDLSWYLMVSDTPRDTPTFRWSSLSPARRIGALPGVLDVSLKRFTVVGRTITTTNTVAARVTAEDHLRDVVVNGSTLTLQLQDGTTPIREIDARVEGTQIRPIGHPLLAVASEATIAFAADDPTWRTAGTSVAVPSVNTRYSLPMGTGPTNLVIRQMGAATNPAITIRRADGQTIAALTFTVTLSASEWLNVDGERGVIEKVSSGTVTSGESLLTSGTFPIPMDPSYWSYRRSAWPTVETSAGSAEVLYNQRYW